MDQKDTVHLKIYTPEGAVLDEAVQSVTLQTADGEIGVLPGHARYISLLGTGILSYTKTNGEKVRLVAVEGFCQFVDGTLTVLADAVDTASAATGRDLNSEKEQLTKEFAQANFFDPAWEIKVSQLKRVQALQQLS